MGFLKCLTCWHFIRTCNSEIRRYLFLREVLVIVCFWKGDFAIPRSRVGFNTGKSTGKRTIAIYVKLFFGIFQSRIMLKLPVYITGY